MLLLYTDSRHLHRLRRAIGETQATEVVGEWERFEIAFTWATCAIFYIEWLPASETFSRLSRFKVGHPHFPVVLVTRWDLENARLLKDIMVEEVVWAHEMDQELASATQRTCALTSMRCLAKEIRCATHLPSPIREALSLACEAERPVRSLKILATLIGRDRRSLWRLWRQSAPNGVLPQLQDVLHWLLLLRAVTLKAPGSSWVAVAARLGVHPHTLARLARALAGVSLRDLEGATGTRLAERFREQVIDPLVGK